MNNFSQPHSCGSNASYDGENQTGKEYEIALVSGSRTDNEVGEILKLR